MRAPPFSPQTDASGLSGSEAALKQLAAQKAQLASQEEAIDLNRSLRDELQQLEEEHEEALEDLGVS